MDIRLYTFHNEHDDEDSFYTFNGVEAQAYAEKNGLALVANIYEFTDSELLWTPNGEDTWPPNNRPVLHGPSLHPKEETQ